MICLYKIYVLILFQVYNDSLSFYFNGFNFSVANDVAIDVAKCTLLGKVI